MVTDPALMGAIGGVRVGRSTRKLVRGGVGKAERIVNDVAHLSIRAKEYSSGNPSERIFDVSHGMV
tara:strand:- start:14163 stop:14360 length:198 start_codon:yes stop_codon:yes gene_type:complete